MFNREKLNIFKKLWLAIDKKILSIFFLFIVFSCIFIFSSSVSVANRLNINNYHFFKSQVFYSILCIFITISISFFSEKVAKKNIFLLFILSLILLIAVHFVGFQTKGSRRWLRIYGLSIQPTELIKPSFILISAWLLERFQTTKIKNYLIINLILYIICLYFIYKQPDIGTLILLSLVFFTQIFLLNIINLKYCLYLFLFFSFLSITSYISLPHVSNRINSFIASIQEPEKANYQVKRSISAYNNSGFLGKGFMEGEVKNFIPDVHTDFIFPAITEEFGFLFVFCIISLYFYLTIRILLKAISSNDFFKFLALVGLGLLFLVQTSINICVSLNLLPTKGMTIPFLSYGGSSLIGTAIVFGFIFVFTKKDLDFKENVERTIIL